MLRRMQRRYYARGLVNVTPEYLTGLFREHTSIQAGKLVEAYSGKWIRLRGPAGDVFDIGEGKVDVTFEPETFERTTVHMFFNDRSTIENQLRVLKKGDWITVVGQIQRVSSAVLMLENCELERP